MSKTTTPTPVAAALDEAGLTRQQVSDALGVSYEAVLHWTSGRNGPSAGNLLPLVELLAEHGVEVEPVDLLRET